MSAAEPRATDRGAWRLVAARDFTVRLRDKGFAISTGITLTVLTVFILLRAFGGGSTPSFDLAITGTEPDRIESLTAEIESAAARRGVDVTIRSYDDEAAAEAAVLSGRVDAALQATGVLTGDASVPAQLTQLVQDAAVRVRLSEALVEGGATSAEIDALLNQPSIEVRTLEPQDPNRDENAGIAFIAVLLAYGQLFGYGVWVATGVIEEKASRVVEILLSAIRPRQLLAGKIAGIGLLGIVQLAGIATFAIVLSVATGAIELPGTAVGIALVVLAWFVMGFAFYAGAVRRVRRPRLAHGGAAERDGADQPDHLRVVLHLDRGAREPGFHPGGRGVGAAVLVGARDARAHRARLCDAGADRALDHAAPGGHGCPRAAVGPAVLRGRAQERLAREAAGGVAVGGRDERDRGRRLRCRRPAGPARTCGMRHRCCATEGTRPPPCTTAWGPTSSSRWRRGG